jgi:hypothetical protein
MYRIAFHESVFHPGFNITVRKGDKHHQALSPRQAFIALDADGDPILNDGEPLAPFRVMGTMLVDELSDIPDALLELNHDPAARTVEGLASALNAAYGAGQWETHDLTVIVFLV